MILIKTKLKKWLKVWMAPVLVAFAVMTAVVVSPSTVMAGQEKGSKKCNDGNDNDGDGLIDSADPDCGGDGSGDGGSDAPSTYNLARASFNGFGGLGDGNGGISADGVDTCTVPRSGLTTPVTYDYWAWQEEIINPAESIYEQHVGDDSDCTPPHNNRSDVSGGGRWFLITTAGPDPLFAVERWLVFDFSERLHGAICPDLDGDGSTGSLGPIYTTDLNPADTDPCVDHLTVRLAADRILKGNASEQTLKLSIRWQPPGSQYWPPWGEVEYLKPLYLRDPVAGGPFAGRDCKVMSTRPSPNDPHDRAAAELYSWETPSTSEFIGTYNLPLEVCVIRTSG